MPTPVTVLADVPLFADLEPRELARIAQSFALRTYARGEVIGGGGLSGCTHVLVSGGARLVRTGPQGRVLGVGVVEPGGVFGRLPFGAADLAEHAEALAESRAASVPAGELARLALVHPMLAARLVEALGERLNATSDRLAGLAFQSVPARVASTLLELADHFGRVTPRGVRVDVRLTHGQLAELVSTTRETLTKVAGWMHAEGLARLDRRELWITDLAAMERVAAGDYQMPGRGHRSLRAV